MWRSVSDDPLDMILEDSLIAMSSSSIPIHAFAMSRDTIDIRTSDHNSSETQHVNVLDLKGAPFILHDTCTVVKSLVFREFYFALKH